MIDTLQVLATSGYEHSLDSIAGDKKLYFRVDDKKSESKITDNSKYSIVAVSARTLVIIDVGQKNSKYSVSIREFSDDAAWGEANWKFFSKKIVREISREEYLSEYKKFIAMNLDEGEDINV